MFDFEKLELYQVLKSLNIEVLKFLASNRNIDEYFRDQWRKATLSAAFNLAEGTGRMSNADKKRFYTIARSSVFECVAIMQIVKEMEWMDQQTYDHFYDKYTQCSKMLLAMWRSTGGKRE